MKKAFGIALASASILAFSAAAHAQSSPWYVVGGIGQGKAKFNNSDYPGAAEAEASLEDDLGLASGTLAGALTRSVDDTDTTWNIGVGYRINRNFAVELGYANLGEYNVSYRTSLAGGVSDSTDYEVSAWKLAAVGMLPLAHGFSIIGKLGFARTEAQAEFRFTASGIDESDRAKEARNGVFWGVGAQYDFNAKVGVRAEYENYGKVGEKFTDAGNEPGEAKISTFNVNLVYSF